jgi:hypothetical protein
MLLNIIDPNGINVSLPNTKVTQVYKNGSASPGGNYVIVDNFTDATWVSFSTNAYLALEFSSGNLNFDHDNLITGINIIDDLLFCTDNENEPKVVNIQRCLAGTDSLGFDATKLFNINLSINNPRKIIPSDINVIKRKPTKKLTIDYSLDKRIGVLQGTAEYTFYNNLGIIFTNGYEGEMQIQAPVSGDPLAYEEGDIILLLNASDIDSGQRILPYEYDVKLVIKSINTNAIPINSITIDYEIISISSLTPPAQYAPPLS